MTSFSAVPQYRSELGEKGEQYESDEGKETLRIEGLKGVNAC